MLLNSLDPNQIIVVVLGGDGTINEILNILIDIIYKCPSYIACGSENDLLEQFSLPFQSSQSLGIYSPSSHY